MKNSQKGKLIDNDKYSKHWKWCLNHTARSRGGMTCGLRRSEQGQTVMTGAETPV